MSCGDAPHLHMLNLIAGSIPASLEFYRRLGVTVPPPTSMCRASSRTPSIYHSQLLGTSTVDTAEGQLFLNRMLAFLQRRHEPAPGRETHARSG